MPTSSPEARAQIRYDYEHTDRPIEEICAEHGIGSGTLREPGWSAATSGLAVYLGTRVRRAQPGLR